MEIEFAPAWNREKGEPRSPRRGHPYIIGVPHRINALRSALDYICAHEGVWLATGEEIVNHYLSSGSTF